jgi:hypothetical protein
LTDNNPIADFFDGFVAAPIRPPRQQVVRGQQIVPGPQAVDEGRDNPASVTAPLDGPKLLPAFEAPLPNSTGPIDCDTLKKKIEELRAQGQKELEDNPQAAFILMLGSMTGFGAPQEFLEDVGSVGKELEAAFQDAVDRAAQAIKNEVDRVGTGVRSGITDERIREIQNEALAAAMEDAGLGTGIFEQESGNAALMKSLEIEDIYTEVSALTRRLGEQECPEIETGSFNGLSVGEDEDGDEKTQEEEQIQSFDEFDLQPDGGDETEDEHLVIKDLGDGPVFAEDEDIRDIENSVGREDEEIQFHNENFFDTEKFKSDPDSGDDDVFRNSLKGKYGANKPYPEFNFTADERGNFRPVTGSIKTAQNGGQGSGAFSLLANSFTSSNLTDAELSFGGGSRKTPWRVFLKGKGEGLNDGRFGADRRSDVYTIHAGLMKQINAKTVLGAQLTFKDGNVKSRALRSNLDGTYYGASAFVRHKLNTKTVFSGMVGFTGGDNELNLNGVTAQFDTDVLTASARIQTTLNLDKISFNPDASFTISKLTNDGFVASDGDIAPEKELTVTHFSVGGKFDQSYFTNGVKGSTKGNRVRTHLGVHLVHTGRTGGLLTLINDIEADEVGFGARVNGGVTIDLKQGIQLGVRGSYTQFNDVNRYSLSGRISKKF